MPSYRRARVPDTIYFFIVKLRDSKSDLLIREIDLLRETISATKAHHPFHIDAWVISNQGQTMIYQRHAD